MRNSAKAWPPTRSSAARPHEYAAAPLVVTGLSGAPARIAEQVLALQAALRRAGMMRDIYLAPSHTTLRPDGGFEVPPERTFTLFSAPPPLPEEVRVDYHTARNGELVMASLPSASHLDQATWASLLTEDTERTYYEWSTRYQEDDGYDSDGIAADGSRIGRRAGDPVGSARGPAVLLGRRRERDGFPGGVVASWWRHLRG